jgi:uncharacterized protein YndB with AHSA1/START domain
MTDQPPPDTATDEGITMTRVFEAPREEVWREWTEPERFADWYGGTAAEIPVESVEMDVRPGGNWRATMHAAGREIQWEGEYLEVDEPERLVLTVTDQPGDDERDVLTVILRDLGDGRTEMRFTQMGGSMPAAGYERAKEGWGGFFARMEERLAD